jgi:hypothetical protein
MEDKVRMVGVRRWFVHTRIDPTWANPGHPSPLSVPLRPYLPGSPVSGTTRVPAPLWKRRAIRRVRKHRRYRVYAVASIILLPLLGAADETVAKCAELLYTYPHAPVKRRASDYSSSQPSPYTSIGVRLSTQTRFLLPLGAQVPGQVPRWFSLSLWERVGVRAAEHDRAVGLPSAPHLSLSWRWRRWRPH